MPTPGTIDTRMSCFLYALLKTSAHEISIAHTNRVDISSARNELINDFLQTDKEYLLFLDDDNPPENVTFLDTLIDADKDIVT